MSALDAIKALAQRLSQAMGRRDIRPSWAQWPAAASPAERSSVHRQGGLWSDPTRARQRQFVMAGVLAVGTLAGLWILFALSDSAPIKAPPAAGPGADSVTNIGVMAPGETVSPVDQWVGTAGRKLAQYESDKEEQTRINKDAKAFEDSTLRRFSELEQRLASQVNAQAGQAPASAPPAAQATAASTTAALSPPSQAPGAALAGQGSPAQAYPPPGSLPTSEAPEQGLPPQPGASAQAGPSGGPQAPLVLPTVAEPPAPVISRVTLSSGPVQSGADQGAPPSATATSATPVATTGEALGATLGNVQAGPVAARVDEFLPVSATQGILLGGLDAPTGGQAQSNPHPVLIRLSDTSVLPSRYRADYKECFVIGSGYGDISAERAYLRTATLSCVREGGQALEVQIEGNVFGEDGKYGLRGRVVSKQGQMLANALLAGVVGGIGQAFSSANTTYSTSALGSIATTGGDQALRSGVGAGVGKALDRLAQYYIKLAEQTFPIIEIDAGRQIDVVITKGVRIDPLGVAVRAPARARASLAAQANEMEGGSDEDHQSD